MADALTYNKVSCELNITDTVPIKVDHVLEP